ncbi:MULTISPECIES: glycosyltransferase family 2 protein [Cytobacillus]|uniref:glycosyltransferase family 2 protein n=1 Tax=Cytobacillus TaxID=2675230 RepID=UPI00203F6A06|nr:glycosyltransferase family 2 protein [Cytobacillus firmus]MCM3708084.1 glycosyltransferase family 2 protein [Cytobacillus firmus]
MKNTNSSPLISIIILTCNKLNFTKQCIRSIFQFTKENFELIVIDNASKDGTVNFLKTLPRTIVINNKINKGFAGGCNQGFRAAKGEYIVLLNNDTVVTDGWLNKMLSCLIKTPTAGIVGPRSNFVIKPQAIPTVPYKTMEEMHKFASEWSINHNSQSFEVNTLSGFCMLFNKNLLEKIGGMDEQFNPGYYEDTDFCLRARLFEKKLMVANDVFIHHFGSSSFNNKRKQKLITIRNNEKKFLNKWNMTDLANLDSVVLQEKPFIKNRHFIPYN